MSSSEQGKAKGEGEEPEKSIIQQVLEAVLVFFKSSAETVQNNPGKTAAGARAVVVAGGAAVVHRKNQYSNAHANCRNDYNDSGK